MSSNGVMLQDYVPSAINNLTEEIWCAGAVIPAGKRVVIGHMRDGGMEITFTMGPMEDFIGMALVPPSVVGIEEPKRIPGVGFMPQGVAAMAVRQGRSQQVAPSRIPNCGPGQELWARGTETSPPYRPFDFQIPVSDLQNALRNNPSLHASTTTFYCRGESSAYAPSRGAIDQNAPLPPSGGSSAFTTSMLPGCYQVNGTNVLVRDQPGQNANILGSANIGDMYYADGLRVYDSHVLLGQHTVVSGHWVRVIPWAWHISPGNRPSGAMWIFEKYLQPCSPTVQPAQSASQAYTSALRQQALPANQSQAPRSSGGGYQVSRIGVHGHGVGDVPEELPEGWPESASPGTGIAIPSYVPGQARPGQSRMGPVWPVGMPAAVASRRIRTAGFHGNDGLGAGGASAFTMTAASALNQELITNNCAGCADMTSRLRQLTFAFKAAVATDTGMPAQNLNMSNMLAMTAYGPATDAALKLVLGAGTAYANGPCTDDAGNCLGNIPTPITPQTIQAIEQQFAQQIQAAIPQTAYLPQADIVHALVQGFTALINRFAVELAKVQPVIPVEATPPPNTGGPCPAGTTRDANGICVSTPAAAAPAGLPWGTILLGGFIGTTILATGALIYTHARRA